MVNLLRLTFLTFSYLICRLEKNTKNWCFLVTQWLRRWIPNPGVPCSKPLGGSKVDSAFHPSKNLVVKSKLPPRSGSSLEAVEPHPEKGAIKFKVSPGSTGDRT